MNLSWEYEDHPFMDDHKFVSTPLFIADNVGIGIVALLVWQCFCLAINANFSYGISIAFARKRDLAKGTVINNFIFLFSTVYSTNKNYNNLWCISEFRLPKKCFVHMTFSKVLYIACSFYRYFQGIEDFQDFIYSMYAFSSALEWMGRLG